MFFQFILGLTFFLFSIAYASRCTQYAKQLEVIDVPTLSGVVHPDWVHLVPRIKDKCVNNSTKGHDLFFFHEGCLKFRGFRGFCGTCYEMGHTGEPQYKENSLYYLDHLSLVLYLALSLFTMVTQDDSYLDSYLDDSDLNDTIATYYPGFANNGKEEITVAEYLLSDCLSLALFLAMFLAISLAPYVLK